MQNQDSLNFHEILQNKSKQNKYHSDKNLLEEQN